MKSSEKSAVCIKGIAALDNLFEFLVETDAGLVFCVFTTQEQVSLKGSLAHHRRFTKAGLGENAQKIVLEWQNFQTSKEVVSKGSFAAFGSLGAVEKGLGLFFVYSFY